MGEGGGGVPAEAERERYGLVLEQVVGEHQALQPSHPPHLRVQPLQEVVLQRQRLHVGTAEDFRGQRTRPPLQDVI